MLRQTVFLLLALAAWIGVAQVVPPVESIFNCTYIPPQENPTNVRQLRPSDIRVVMALGDSITAGFGMMDSAWVFNAMFEYRGHVASIGSDEHAVTIPNFLKILKKEAVHGGSLGRELPWDAIQWQKHIVRPYNPDVDHLNAAQSMAKSMALIEGHGGSNISQIDYLVQQLRNKSDVIDMNKDWKLLTILIGANDLCVTCMADRNATSAPDVWIETIDKALTQIQAQIPRVFVNVVPLFNISQVWKINREYEYCRFVWDYIVRECPCLKTNDVDRHNMDVHSLEYNERLFALADRWNAKQLPDFHIGVQTYLQELIIPGKQFLSNLDCFHPSALSNVQFAVGLWNSMLLPLGKKPTNLDPKMTPICPTMDTYLQ